MNAKVCIFLCLVLAVGEITAQLSHKGGNCPMRNTVSKCMPSCMSDYQCNFNQKCCPNKCGSMSCASPSSVNTGDDGGYKGSSNGGSGGVYCAGTKCGAYEKCEFDRNTKRDKCVRT